MSLLKNAQKAGKHIGGATNKTSKQPSAFGKDIEPKIAPVLGGAWKQMSVVGQEARKLASAAAKHTKQWVEQHPGETAGMIVCVVAAPLGIGATYTVLHMVGFTAKGVAAGSAAAAAQSSMGGAVAAGSTFAVLQSATAGGASATFVSGVAGGTTTGFAIAATASGLIKALREGKNRITIDEVKYKIDDEGGKNLRQKVSKL